MFHFFQDSFQFKVTAKSGFKYQEKTWCKIPPWSRVLVRITPSWTCKSSYATNDKSKGETNWSRNNNLTQKLTQNTRAPKIKYLLSLRTGELLGVSVHTTPEVNLGGWEVSHDPLGGIYTYFLLNLAPQIEQLLWEIDRYHSDGTVKSLD